MPASPPPQKRRRLEQQEPRSANAEARLLRRGIASLNRSVSPPLARRQATSTLQPEKETHAGKKLGSTPALPRRDDEAKPNQAVIPSPFQLTRIRDLPASANVDTVSIDDVLRDPLITETWVFNYMFDVDWLMSCLDSDTRDLTKVKVIHGNWKREDAQRMRMEAWAQQYPNLEVITAYMPEPYGTHHSKMMVNFRADETAQVVIHTANMISQDWTNMTQAVWRSPLLPLLPNSTKTSSQGRENHPIGSGPRFGSDLHAYLSAYGAKLRPLVTRIALHDFHDVRAALVASVPGRVNLNKCDPARKTAWGWVGLREVLAARQGSAIDDLEDIKAKEAQGRGRGMVVAQVSSIASLGATDRWLQHFHSVLSTPAAVTPPSSSISDPPRPPLRIIFPTPPEIRRSLDGYASGSSIHTKTQANATQKKQAEYLRPYLCRWDTTAASAATGRPVLGDANRGTAAPHVKTYVRFSRRVDEPAVAAGDENPEDVSIDWALLTSANLSTQAWGAMAVDPNASGSKKKKASQNQRDEDSGGGDAEVRICSWEVGVCVWPGLFADSGPHDGSALGSTSTSTSTLEVAPGPATAVVMTPVFTVDRPSPRPLTNANSNLDMEKEKEKGKASSTASASVSRANNRPPVHVGLRIPYSLPLQRYRSGDEMWCATQPCDEVDRLGRAWGGFGAG